MTNEEKAKELAKIFFPDILNVFARENLEQKKAFFACMEMAEWKEKQIIEKVCEWLKDNEYDLKCSGYSIEDMIDFFKKDIKL